MMNIRQVETFAAVMKTGTASRAAETLGITQPAVSRSLAELERAVGFSLFARIRNRLKALKLFTIGASWGGTRSLIAPMSVKADRTAVPWRHDGAILRISIGLEDPGDLWNDLDGMLRSIDCTEIAAASA